MLHSRRRSKITKATFHRDTDVELTGHEQYGSSIHVEVEFSAERDTPPGDDDPGDAGDREILGVRVFIDRRDLASGFKTAERLYCETPPWLAEAIKGCIDVDALPVDWSDVEE